MGLQGPLAALALGRSPYDEVFHGSGEPDHREPLQRFDARGRPINPETRKLNRDLIRAHNEVMLVIGVAEPENPNAGPEAENQRLHYADEEAIGSRLTYIAHRCVQAVGVFGVDGARQRILVYKQYSRIPFWDLFLSAKRNFSLSSMVMAGAPSSLVSNRVESIVVQLWLGDFNRRTARRMVHEIWSYVRVHLELYAALQRLGILSNDQWFPSLSFFVPFSSSSPIPSPHPLRDLSWPSVLEWLGNAFICATPFLLWVFSRRMVRDWRPRIWYQILDALPSTIVNGRMRQLPPALPLPPTTTPMMTPGAEEVAEVLDQLGQVIEPQPIPEADEGENTSQPNETQAPVDEDPPDANHENTRGDDAASDDEDNEDLSATLISFDVEATDSVEAPIGPWSAELRPSAAGPQPIHHVPLYLDTMLTTLPTMLAADILTDALVRLMVTPYEAVALRKIVAMFLLRQGLSTAAICMVNPFEGLSIMSFVSFLSIEFLNLTLSGEVWAITTRVAQYLHLAEEEWKDDANGLRRSWLHVFLSRPGRHFA